jgi:hypothetical protein
MLIEYILILGLISLLIGFILILKLILIRKTIDMIWDSLFLVFVALTILDGGNNYFYKLPNLVKKCIDFFLFPLMVVILYGILKRKFIFLKSK